MAKPILIVVDDEPDMADFVKDVAEMVGFETLTANNGKEFQGLCATVSPDAIVLDVVMPDMDGLELLQWISGNGYSCPVILISGYDGAYIDTAARFGEAQKVQVAGTLSKPIPLAEMEALLTQVHKSCL